MSFHRPKALHVIVVTWFLLPIALFVFKTTAAAAQIPALVGGQDAQAAPAQDSGLLLPDDLDAELLDLSTRVQASTMTEEEKRKITETIAKASKNRRDAGDAARRAQQYQSALPTIADRADALKATGTAAVETGRPSADASLSELETQLAALSAERASIKQAVAEAEAAISKSVLRRTEIDSELSRLTSGLESRDAQVAAALSAVDGTLAGEAMIEQLKSAAAFSRARLSELQNEKALLNAELAANLPQLTLDRHARKLEQIELRLEALKKAVDSKRAVDAAERVEKADRQADELHPTLQPIGAENQRLASLNQELAGKIEEVERTLKLRTDQLEALRRSRADAAERVNQVGLTAAVGAMLRNLKQNLPNVSAYELKIGRRTTEIDDANYDLMDLTDRRNEPLKVEVENLFRASRSSLSTTRREQLEEEARALFQQQRTDYLDPVIHSQTKYFNTLVEISTTEELIIQLVETTRRYINENVLWTRSTQPLLTQPRPNQSEWWFARDSAWSEVGPRLSTDITHHVASWGAALFAISVLIAARYRLRERIAAIGDHASQSGFTRFYPTIQTLVLTVAASAPVPVLFWFSGERLAAIAGDDRTLSALAVAAKIFASMYAMLELIRHVCRKKGLAECHFDWPQHAIVTVRRNLRLLLYIAVPLTTFSSFLAAGAQGYGNDVLERYFYLAALAILCVFLIRTFHPRRGAPAHFLGRHPEGWANRLSSVWYPVMIAIPVLLAALSLIGYHFTSWRLGGHFFQSITLLFAIGVTISIAMRWSIIHRRAMRFDQLRQQRASQESADSRAEAELPITLPDESGEELQEQLNQSRNLFLTAMAVAAVAGIWLVWRDIMPALDRLDQWPAWTSTTTLTEWTVNDQGVAIAQTREAVDPVTYAEVALALIIMTIAFGAARNLPGLLEFVVLRRLPIDRSIRYAITTLVSYAIILFGLVVACSTIGVQWNQIQWMATALTFGLAFGLQEMFANFVAGIIILFEQPVRVGDVVEIDGITGIVSKIRIRATTITDWDRKDYIVPNKEFITGKLLNWTRSDEIVRITIDVGVAYGSDTKKTRELLLEAAAEHPDVLVDPPVLATFSEFGDSSLSFKLRVFVNTYERRLHIGHDLREAIDHKFRKADIEISFPQRDLHLRTYPQEMVKFFRATRDLNAREKTKLQSTTELNQ
jgi:potassium efflux system protein